MNNRTIRNKRGQVYIIAVIITIVFALISSFILIGYASSEKSTDEYIGVYQSGMIDAIVDGDKTLIYLQQVAKYSSNDALQDFADNGGAIIYNDKGEEKPPECKTYVYNLWNSESAECYPDYEESLIQYMYKSMIPRLQVNPDVNLQKETPFEFKYGTSSIESSSLSALSDIQYEYYVFKSREYKDDPAIQGYIDNKRVYSDGTSYTVGVGECKDIVAFADKYIGASWSRNTIALPPEEAKVKGLQCGAFVTSVFKFGSNMAAPLGNGNQKCYNFATGTVSPTVEMIYKRNTDFKCITSVSCMMGLQPLSEKELDNMKLMPGDIFSSTTPTSYGAPYGHTGIYVGKGRLESPRGGSGWQFNKFIPDPNGKHVAIHSGIAYSYISDLEANNRKMIAFCRHKGCITDKNPVNQVNCQVKSNSDWKITNIQAIPKLLSGEQTVTILTTIENPSSECASVAARPIITASGQNTYVVDGKKMIDVYKDNKGQSYVNIETKCTFITDKNKLNSERGADKCVLLAPTDGSTIKYTIKAGAIDAYTRIVTESKTVEFEVSKPGTSGQTGNGNQQTTMHDFSMLITDSEFRDISMSQQSIQTFLERKGSVLKDPIDGKLPSQTISDISKKSSINPIVLLVTLQKEQSLITAKTATKDKLSKAMGCGCPDTGPCDPKYYGFENQIKCAVDNVYLRHFNAGLKNNYPYEFKNIINYGGKCPKNSNTGQNSIVVQNAATYALYKYTPHTYDICLGDGKTGGGNYLFLELMKSYYKEITGKEYGTGTGTLNAQYQQVAIDEIEGKGIIGKYYVNPSFTVDVPFDLSLIDNLSKFMNQTTNECRISQLGKEPCLDAKIAEFNAATGALYKANGINIELTRECDNNADEKLFNEFIESVEDCALSPDFDCQCDLKKSSALRINIESDDESALFSFTKSGITYDVASYNKFLDAKNDPLKLNAVMNTITLHKRLGYLKSGTITNRQCTIPESRFRLCLKTDYHTEEYDGQSLKEKNVTLKFAITIKDNDAPPPLTAVELINMKNSRNSVIVIFDESKKNGQRVPDVGSYNIYMSDVATDFNNDMKTIRNTVRYRTLDILTTGYDKIQGLDFTQTPECEIVDDNYCVFKYNAKDSSGADIKIELEEDKVYFMTDKEKFFYILNGSDSYNALNSGRDKYIAVTAVDTDGNEIDNVNTTQKITLGQNLQNIKPEDDLAPGFVQVTATINTVTNRIYLSYAAPTFYINGEPMDNAPILYRAYIDWDCQNQNVPEFCNVIIPTAYKAETGGLTMDIDRTMVARVGVIPVIKKNNIDAQYISGFTESITQMP